MSCYCSDSGSCSAEQTVEKSSWGGLQPLTWRLLAASVFFVVGLFLGKGGALPFLFHLLAWSIAGYQVLWNAVQNFRHGQIFDENVLMSVATIGAFAIGEWSEAVAVMLFYNLGEMVQARAVSRSKQSITELFDLRSDTARLAAGGAIVAASELSVGSVIEVLPGEKVPLDGVVVGGSSRFDTASLTGESLPRVAEPGSVALAGFINGSGVVQIETTALCNETAASKMVKLIEESRDKKSKSERLITSFAKIYTPIVTLGAVLIAVLPPLWIGLASGGAVPAVESFVPWIRRGLIFLVISCPCAFIISVPLGYFGGIGAAARRGILVKGAEAIDGLAQSGAVLFDKTGTLTRGRFRVEQLEPAHGVSEEELVQLLYHAERFSNHPLAEAFCSWVDDNQQLSTPFVASDVDQIEERAGWGISLCYRGEQLLVGSKRLLLENGIDLPSPHPFEDEWGSVIEVALNSRYIGAVLMRDQLREGAAEMVAQLQQLGIRKMALLSGDRQQTVEAVASELKIGHSRGDLLPHQKVEEYDHLIEQLKEESGQKKRPRALFVGDGLNDAALLARADVGIALGGMGNDLAMEAADLVIAGKSLTLVAEAVVVARRTRRIVGQNIALSFVIKLGFLAFGAVGIATLWEAVFADVGVALLALANASRLQRKRGELAV